MSGLKNLSFRDSGLFAQWAALIALTLLFGGVLTALRLPAGLLLGAIAAAASVSAFEGRIEVPPWAFLMAQAAIGGMIAQKLTPAILHEMARDWPLFLAAGFSVIAASGLFGWLLTRWRLFPGTTRDLGALPGAASAMVVMADAYGADMRLVAFMQYLRVLLVALVASLIARFLDPRRGAGAAALAGFAPLASRRCLGPPSPRPSPCCSAPAFLAHRLRLPAGPLLAAAFPRRPVQDFGLLTLELPRPFLALNYALLGWSIGQRFTRATPAARFQGAARDPRLDRGADRALRRAVGDSGGAGPYRPDDRLSRHEPRRRSTPSPSSPFPPSSTCPSSWPCRRRGC